MMRRALIILLARSWSCSKKSLPVVPSASAFVAGPAKHTSVRFSRSREQSHQPYRSFVASAIVQYTRSPVLLLLAKPKKAGSTVDSYQTVSVNCSKCQQQLFRYKKKNGTKSNLVKCYVERICEDSAGVLALAASKQQKQTVSSVSSSTSPDSDTNENNTTKKDRKRKRKQNPTKNLINSDNGNDKAATTPEHKEPNVVTIPTQLDPEYSWECPSCHTQFARSSLIHGRPALKMVGGKIRMTKK